jgi:hypothetical protein
MTMTAVAKRSLSTACNSCVSNIGRGANKVSLEKFPPTARNRAAQIDLRQNPIIERSDNQHVIDGSKFTGVGDQNCSLSKLNERASLAWINVVRAFEVHP